MDKLTSHQSGKSAEGPTLEPALALSRAWLEAHARTLALCLKQQQIEAEIAVTVGFPSSDIASSNGEESHGPALGETDVVCPAMPVTKTGEDERTEVASDHWARWQAKDAELGYSATKEAEHQAAGEEQRLLDRLATTPAQSIAGVIAKLAVVLRDVEDNRDASDFPMPQLRSVLSDLTRVTHHTVPDGPQLLPFSDAGMSNGQCNARG